MATMEAQPNLQIRLHQGAFKNEPFFDFGKEVNVRNMRAAIEKVWSRLNLKCMSTPITNSSPTIKASRPSPLLSRALTYSR